MAAVADFWQRFFRHVVHEALAAGMAPETALEILNSEAMKGHPPGSVRCTTPQQEADALGSTGAGLICHSSSLADGWSVIGWLDSLNLHTPVDAALYGMDFDLLSQRLSRQDLATRLREHNLEGLFDSIWQGILALRQQGASTAAGLHSKFVESAGTFEMAFGSIDLFYGGLEALVGPPLMIGGSLIDAMEAEHCAAEDCDLPFSTPNGFDGVTSSSEWEFVVSPKPRHTYQERADMRALYPDGCREPVALSVFEERMLSINEKLHAGGHPPLVTEELVGGRLYTTAMYHKYNSVLRSFSGNARLLEMREALVRSNMYPTTIHAVNSCCIKLSKLTRSCTVWRGTTSATLPPMFWEPNTFGFCGGIEFGFCSTTMDRAQAEHYSTGVASTRFALQLGMIDRGADISWMSAYPSEQEIVFPPLLGLQVVGTRVEGHTLSIACRPNLNMAALTLEQVVSKRRKLLLDMSRSVALEVSADLSSRDAEHVGKQCYRSLVEPITGPLYEDNTRPCSYLCQAEFSKLSPEEQAGCTAFPPWSELPSERAARAELVKALLHDGIAMAQHPSWFNSDTNFSNAVSDALAIKRGVSEFGTKIHLRDCTTLRHMSEQICRCSALQILFIVNAPSLESLPDLLFFDCPLTNVDLHKCTSLRRLPDSLAHCSKLTTLRLKRCFALTRLPSLAGCSHLQTLCVTYCTGISELPASLGGCTRLTHLELIGSASILALPPLSNLTSLETLILSGCGKLTALPDGLRSCRSLRLLELRDCSELSTLPEELGSCNELQHVDCTGCTRLTRLPTAVGQWTALISLTLMSCSSLEELPELGHCTKLLTLSLAGCTALCELPAGLGGCTALQDLFLQGCSAISALPHSLSDCKALNTLNLTGCSALGTLPDLDPRASIRPPDSHVSGI